MTQITTLSSLQKTMLTLLQQLVDLPGLHRFALLLHVSLFGRRRYYASYLKRFRFVFDTCTRFGYLSGLGLVHRDIDKTISVLFQLIPHHEIVFFDIGANEGFVTFLAHSRAQQLRRTLEAYCFEPNLTAFKHLQKNAHLNSFLLHTHQVAVGASVEEREMLFTEKSSDSTLLLASAQQAVERSIVQVTTIDRFCEEYRVIPEVIKIDVEGYELNVLNGATTTLSLHKPFLMMEVNPSLLALSGGSADSLITRLRQLGYDLYYIDSRIAIAVKPPHSLATGPHWHGYYAVEDDDQIDRYLWDVLAVPHQPAS